MLEAVTDIPTEIMAYATLVMAMPTVWGAFVLVRGAVRKLKRNWQAWKERIAAAAVAAHEERRLIDEGLKKAEKEAEERRLKHAAAEEKQEQYNHIVLDLQQQFAGQADVIAGKVKTQVGEAVREANAEQTEKIDALQNWATQHDANDNSRFGKIDDSNARTEAAHEDVIARLERIETGVTNGHGQ